MHDSSPSGQQPYPEDWVIWNGGAAILAMVALGRVEHSPLGRVAWLARPFHMVGPFSLDELETQGRIAFAACVVMSRQRWQEDQAGLRQEAYEKRRAARQRMEEDAARFNAGFDSLQRYDDRQHRETLQLPVDGELDVRQIKRAFRRLAQKMHPDMGGSHEQFLRITAAKKALLDSVPQ
ncbi:J domain-containing protein [Methyloversatilis thermotolerans]|uniref:J domain-containing protein n=1 Tax=Methyloversatilis thermotolerans TaxID=1346290 RepID=UPI0003A6410D|nr:J domain-containing protein [Methyloversatilis thermotolerans]